MSWALGTILSALIGITGAGTSTYHVLKMNEQKMILENDIIISEQTFDVIEAIEHHKKTAWVWGIVGAAGLAGTLICGYECAHETPDQPTPPVTTPPRVTTPVTTTVTPPPLQHTTNPAVPDTDRAQPFIIVIEKDSNGSDQGEIDDDSANERDKQNDQKKQKRPLTQKEQKKLEKRRKFLEKIARCKNPNNPEHAPSSDNYHVIWVLENEIDLDALAEKLQNMFKSLEKFTKRK